MLETELLVKMGIAESLAILAETPQVKQVYLGLALRYSTMHKLARCRRLMLQSMTVH
jgi:hypothetical protein